MAEHSDAHPESLLVAAAKTIGAAAGKIAAVSGVKPAQEVHPPQPKRRGRLAPKKKARVPRRQKKAQKRRSAA